MKTALNQHRRFAWLTCINVFSVPQYSQKEDKYEEEIKVLTDKLKEVKFYRPFIQSPGSLFLLGLRHVNSILNLSPHHRLRLALSLLRDQ